MMRKWGTSVTIPLPAGLSRDTRRPLFGSLIKRCRPHVGRPMYVELLSKPVPFFACPRIVVSPQGRPPGPGTFRLLSSLAIARGPSPAEKRRNISWTTSASAELILRTPVTGAPVASTPLTMSYPKHRPPPFMPARPRPSTPRLVFSDSALRYISPIRPVIRLRCRGECCDIVRQLYGSRAERPTGEHQRISVRGRLELVAAHLITACAKQLDVS
jgi:hypothetical protein